MTEHHPAAPCGSVIPEDLEKLRWLGKEIWKSQLEKKEPIEVIVWDASGPEPEPEDLSLRLQRTGVTKEVKSIVREIHNEVRSINLSPIYLSHIPRVAPNLISYIDGQVLVWNI